jgi:hypothetical protein
MHQSEDTLYDIVINEINRDIDRTYAKGGEIDLDIDKMSNQEFLLRVSDALEVVLENRDAQ